MNQFDADECRAAPDRLVERRKALIEANKALGDALETWIRRSRDVGLSMPEIGRRLGITKQRVLVYLKPGRRPKPKR